MFTHYFVHCCKNVAQFSNKQLGLILIDPFEKCLTGAIQFVAYISAVLMLANYMYYLKHEHECFIRYKTRGAAERFISDKARIASVLNSFKNDPFYTHLVSLFTKEFSI